MPVSPMFHIPQQDSDMLKWAFFNIAHHRDVSNWLQFNKQVSVENFAIYPLPPQEGLGAWLLNHQSWHTQINSVLGTRSNNLLSVNFQDYNALSAWIFLHATEHQAWEAVTGVP